MRRLALGFLLTLGAAPVLAAGAMDDEIAAKTSGYQRFKTQEVDLGKPAPIKFTGHRGDCLVVVLRLQPGASVKEAPVVDLKEPTRGWGMGYDTNAGGVTPRYCLTADGAVTVSLRGGGSIVVKGAYRPDPVVGKGRGSFEIWKTAGSQTEIASGDDQRAAQKARDKKWDAIHADLQSTGCPDCRKQRDDCRAGHPPHAWKVAGDSCDKGFAHCLSARDVAASDCP
jgi:hypothetical protein